MKNVVVEVTSEEHGAEVIQAFKDLGVDTYGFTGSLVGYHYGLINWVFTGHSTPQNSQVITLEELKAMKNPYPKVMWVWDFENQDAIKREVLNEIEHKGIKGYITFDGEDLYVYRNAKNIEEPIEITLDQIAEKFGVNVEQIKIKK